MYLDIFSDLISLLSFCFIIYKFYKLNYIKVHFTLKKDNTHHYILL